MSGVPGPHRHTKFHRSGFKNVSLQPQKSRKITIFGINLPLWKNFWGPQKNLSSCTTTNLPACNDTITVLIVIVLLHSVSVITNFVIPKRDKQTNKQTKNITLFSSTAGARPTVPTILGMVIEDVLTIFALPNFF